MAEIPTVAVTGIGVVSPLGSLPVFWERLCAGENGIAPIEGFDPGDAPPTTGARVRDWQPKAHIRPALLRRMDRLSQMVVTAARQALADAGLTLAGEEAEAAGIVFGTAYGNIAESEGFLRGLFAKGPALANPLTFPNLVLNAPSGYVAIDLGLQGPNLTVCRAEASGEAAIALAYDTIVSGQADVLLAGGADEIAPVLFHVYKDLGVLSPRGGDRRRRAPEWSSPFDRDRNGFVMGEGAAFLVLERAEHAVRRGAAVYATIAGYATTTAAASPHDWPQAGDAVGAAEIPDCPRTVDFVVSCANSTRDLDAFEAARLSALLGDSVAAATVTSVKGALGDFGAAGAFSVAAAALALRSGVVPPLAALREPETDGLRFARSAVHAPARGFRTALVSGSPRGGACLTLVLGSAPW